MAGIPKVKITFDADFDELKKGIKGGQDEIEGFGSKVGDFSKKAGLAFAAAAAAAGAMAIKIGVDAVKAASDLSETISKVGVLFGDTSQDIEDFASTAAKSLGQTKQQALDAAATFATFGKSAGLSGKDLGKFSTDFVKLASDLASFNNTTPEQAINAIGSALRGEAEPLRAYGVLLDDASLRQAALELGIISTTKNALTPQQKVLAAQALIYQQTGAAQGDFERTSDGLANRTRILTAQLENAKVTIGDALLPVVLKLATFFSENVIPVVEKLSTAFGSNVGGMGSTLTTLATSIKTFVQPIFDGFKSAFDKIKNTVVENKDEFESFFEVVKAAAPVVGSIIGTTFSVVGSIASTVLNLIANVLGALKGIINTAIDGINLVIKGINLIKPGDDIASIAKIGSTSLPIPTGNGTSVASSSLPSGFGTRAMGGPVSAGSSYLVGERGPELFTPSKSGNITPNNSLGGNTYNITVNGAIDSEGTARQIINVLNNSFYRGTGGATALVG